MLSEFLIIVLEVSFQSVFTLISAIDVRQLQSMWPNIKVCSRPQSIETNEIHPCSERSRRKLILFTFAVFFPIFFFFFQFGSMRVRDANGEIDDWPAQRKPYSIHIHKWFINICSPLDWMFAMFGCAEVSAIAFIAEEINRSVCKPWNSFYLF